MITGQNTEIRHHEVVYHVQTEDKGKDNPLVVTLIYVGGRVLAAKRTSYDQLLAGGGDESEIAELLNRQHRTILAAIRHGRFDEQVRRFLAEPGQNGGGAEGSVETSTSDPAVEDSDDASLDEMVGRYLGADVPESLRVELAPHDAPEGGRELRLAMSARAAPTRRALAGVTLRVELISPLREPVVLWEGNTDEEGRGEATFLVPPVVDPMAVLIVTASCELGRFEETLLL